MIPLKRTRSLTDFKRNARTLLKHLGKTGEPEILTVRGKPTLIVQSAAVFYEMLHNLERGLHGLEVTNAQPFRTALDEIRTKYKISSPNT